MIYLMEFYILNDNTVIIVTKFKLIASFFFHNNMQLSQLISSSYIDQHPTHTHIKLMN